MNLFVLDTDPEIAASYHCDKHVVKMILESAQLLCCAHHVLDPNSKEPPPYRKTHVNHPCSVWVREGTGNYFWTIELGLALCREYTKRYEGRRHKTQDVLEWCRSHLPKGLPEKPLEPFVQAMPPKYQGSCPVAAYRAYYKGEKSEIARWKYSDTPPWWTDGDQ